MSYDGREIANFVLDFCDARNRKVSHLSLQKIVYFCHACFLAEFRKPLVRHAFEAWEFGPVLQYLYHEFKAFERSPITTRAKKINIQTGAKEKVVYHFDEQTRNFLTNVINFYSQLTPTQLVEISHMKGGPWDKVWNHKGQINPGMKIEDREIMRYYSQLQETNMVQ